MGTLLPFFTLGFPEPKDYGMVRRYLISFTFPNLQLTCKFSLLLVVKGPLAHKLAAHEPRSLALPANSDGAESTTDPRAPAREPWA